VVNATQPIALPANATATAAPAPVAAAPVAGKGTVPAQIVGQRPVVINGQSVYAAPVVNPLMINSGVVSGYIPYEYRRALRNVGKTLQLLDRSYDAVTAHLRQLSVMRAKVMAKYHALRSRAGVIVAPPVASHMYVAPHTRRLLKRYYTGSLAETDSQAEEQVEEQAEEEIDPEQILSFIEAAEQANAKIELATSDEAAEEEAEEVEEAEDAEEEM